MHILLNLAISWVVLFGMAWAFLPGGFGLINFKRNRRGPVAWLATVSWYLLLLVHPFVLYQLWFGAGHVYAWLLLPVLMHLGFFPVFGRDVGTR